MVKDTKLQMLTTRFEELKISEDESFDSFYGKLNEVVIGKFNLGKKMKDSKIVRKILRSLLESFRAKITVIEESKDLNDIKVQELIGSLQTYELSLPSQRKSKSYALKTINERVDAHDSSDEDEVNKDVAYLVKNFQKFLKFKKNGKFAEKGKFPNFGKEKRWKGLSILSRNHLLQMQQTWTFQERVSQLFESEGQGVCHYS